MDIWMSDRQSCSKNATTTAEGNDNVNGHIEPESFWWGKKSVMAREWQASQGKALAHWYITEKQSLESAEPRELGECAISGRMWGKDRYGTHHGGLVNH
jgi:hypothetical protein